MDMKSIFIILLGKEVYQGKTNSDELKVDFSLLKAGIYIVEAHQ
jgi:hypothetical protein